MGNDKTAISYQMAKFVVVVLALFLASVAAFSVPEELEESSFLQRPRDVDADDDSSSAVDEVKPKKLHLKKLEKEGKVSLPATRASPTCLSSSPSTSSTTGTASSLCSPWPP